MSELNSLDSFDIITQESHDDFLRTIVKHHGYIIGAFLVSMEGNVIASYSPSHINEANVAALGATMTSIGHSVCLMFQKGEFEYSVLCNKKGFLIAISLRESMILVLETSPDFDVKNEEEIADYIEKLK
jgi:predicted regulator of Ras-like GTPase activity (Roadblock/LC7/MglB family)